MARRIEVEIIGDASGLSRTMKAATRDADRFGSKVGGAFSSIAKVGVFAGVTAGIVGMGAVLRAGIGEWEEQAKVASATSAILEATGGVANVTAKDVSALAESIMAKTGVDDEAIQAGENLLLTFKNVRNEVGAGSDVFDRATRAAVDLSSAGFGSMESASKMLGKALNDPVKGMTALSRAGVTFSEDQKKAIKALTETGDILGAQKLILNEVESQVGGVAEAYGKTLPGQIDILKQQFSNLSGTIVGALAPAFAAGLSAVNGFIQKFAEADGAAAKFKVVATTIRDAAVLAGQNLVAAFRSIDWSAVGRSLVDGFGRAFDLLSSSIRRINWAAVGRDTGNAIISALNQIPPMLARVNWGAVGQEMIRGMGRGIQALGSFLAGVDWGAVLGAFFRAGLAALKAYGQLQLGIMREAGGAAMRGLQAGFTAGWAAVSAWLRLLPGAIMSLFVGAGSWLYNAGVQVLEGFWNGLKAKAADIKNWLQNEFTRGIPSWKGPPSKDKKLLEPAATMIMEGFQRRLQSAVPGTQAALRAHTTAITREVNALQRNLDRIQRNREDSDNRAALSSALTALAAARKKGEGVLAAEREVERAREQIRVAALNRELAAKQAELTAQQTHYDKVHDQYVKAQEKLKASQQKTLDAMQKQLRAAQSRAESSFSRLSELIQRGFDAVNSAWMSGADQKLGEIAARRQAEDLDAAVDDAQRRLQEAREGDDPQAVADAQRALARAREDIQIAALERQAANERDAHDKQVQAQTDALNQALEATRKRFTETGVESGKGMATILDIINSYVGGFKTAGETLGGAFASALRQAVAAAVGDADRIAGGSGKVNVGSIPIGGGGPVGGRKLPLLAKGGTIAQTGAAIVHKGETVVPAGGAGTTFHFTINGVVGDAQDVAKTIVDTINREQRVGRLRFAS